MEKIIGYIKSDSKSDKKIDKDIDKLKKTFARNVKHCETAIKKVQDDSTLIMLSKKMEVNLRYSENISDYYDDEIEKKRAEIASDQTMLKENEKIIELLNLQANDFIDIKGVGLGKYYHIQDGRDMVIKDKTPNLEITHSSGLLTMSEALYDYMMENIIRQISDKSDLFKFSKVSTIKSYAIIDLGIKIKNSDENAALYIRQSHRRYTENVGLLTSESGLLLQSEFAKFGINVYQSGILIKKSIAVHATRELVSIDDTFWSNYDKYLQGELYDDDYIKHWTHLFDFDNYTIVHKKYGSIVLNILLREMSLYNITLSEQNTHLKYLVSKIIDLEKYFNSCSIETLIDDSINLHSLEKNEDDISTIIYNKWPDYSSTQIGRIDLLVRNDLNMDIGYNILLNIVKEDKNMGEKIKEITEIFSKKLKEKEECGDVYSYKKFYCGINDLHSYIHEFAMSNIEKINLVRKKSHHIVFYGGNVPKYKLLYCNNKNNYLHIKKIA